MATELLSPFRQRAVELVANAHPRASIGTKITLAIDQDRRNPLEQKLLDEPQGNRRLPAPRRSDKRRMPRQFFCRQRYLLSAAIGRRADNEGNGLRGEG